MLRQIKKQQTESDMKLEQQFSAVKSVSMARLLRSVSISLLGNIAAYIDEKATVAI